MTKKEMIWRYILEEALAGRQSEFTQKDVAAKFHFSTSTVFNALKIPRKLEAIEVSGRFFRMRDIEKFLIVWATFRNLKKDIIYSTKADLPPQNIEASMPPAVIFGGFSAYRLKYGDPPADYSLVYVYSDDIQEIKKRFPPRKGYANIFVLKPDAFLASYGKVTPDSQTFADLWNMREWYAKDFLVSLKAKFLHGILS